MRIPDSLADLVHQGIIDAVVRPLKGGKEAYVFLIEVAGGHCVAKVYKDADQRTFKHRSQYTEGRKVRNSRDQRAMNKRTSYGQKKEDDAWRAAEVEAIYRLRGAGVRVPEPYHYVDGVLLMELIQDHTGAPAPRLAEAPISRAEAPAIFEQLLRESVRMLSAGVVHGDLSEFNILMGADGPVIIDFPQWVDAARNQNARRLLIRDLDNLRSFLRRFDPSLRRLPYGVDMGQAYERSVLTPETNLTGVYSSRVGEVDLEALAYEIQAAEAEARKERCTDSKQSNGRRHVAHRRPTPEGQSTKGSGSAKRRTRGNKPVRVERPGSTAQKAAKPNGDRPAKPLRKRRRRRRKKPGVDGRKSPSIEQRPMGPDATRPNHPS